AGGFFGAQADEKAKLDQFCLDRVLRGELIESVIDREKLIVSVGGCEIQLLDVHSDLSAAVTPRAFAASPVNEDTAHGLSGGREEMSASGELRVVVAHQPQPGFMHQSGVLQRVARGF